MARQRTTPLPLFGLGDDDLLGRDPGYDAERFRIDARTQAVGLAGIARARAVLEASRRAREQASQAA